MRETQRNSKQEEELSRKESSREVKEPSKEKNKEGALVEEEMSQKEGRMKSPVSHNHGISHAWGCGSGREVEGGRVVVIGGADTLWTLS